MAKKRGAKKSVRYPHGPSIKNPAVYDALRREGRPKESAARISNSALKKHGKRGKKRSKKAR